MIPASFTTLHEAIRMLQKHLTELAWDTAEADTLCTCGARMQTGDGYHSKHCERRGRVEELEAGLGVPRQ